MSNAKGKYTKAVFFGSENSIWKTIKGRWYSKGGHKK